MLKASHSKKTMNPTFILEKDQLKSELVQNLANSKRYPLTQKLFVFSHAYVICTVGAQLKLLSI